MSSLIKLIAVSKIYHRHQSTEASGFAALKQVNLELKCGEMISIMGASGSGKSTLMNIMGFLDRCTTGEYWFAGENVSNLSDIQLATIRNRKIGFVFQSFFLLPRLTAIQNVMLPLLYRHISRAEAQVAANQVLEKVSISALASHYPNQLSGGQQQRVAIARALIGEPEVILADEPTGALDSHTGNEVMALFSELHQKEGRTIVIITHDESISHYCERVITMKDGAIVESTK